MSRLRAFAEWLGLTPEQSAAAGVAPADYPGPTGITYTTDTGRIMSRTQGADPSSYGYGADLRLYSEAYGGTGSGRGFQYYFDGVDALTSILSITPPGNTVHYTPNVDNQVASTDTAGTIVDTKADRALARAPSTSPPTTWAAYCRR
jgi:hypothetical protein